MTDGINEGRMADLESNLTFERNVAKWVDSLARKLKVVEDALDAMPTIQGGALRRSQSIAQLAGALAKAQGEMKPAALNAVNPFLKNTYADLGSVIAASREALSKNGLAVIQSPNIDRGDVLTITTLLAHESGEWVESELSLSTGSSNKGLSAAQAVGSVITYLRRYAYSSILGIHTGDDNDGSQSPEPKRVQRKAAPERAAPPTRPYTPEQVKAGLDAFIAKTGEPVKLPQAQYFKVVEAIENLFVGSSKEDKEQARHAVLFYLFGTTSTKEMTVAQKDAVIQWAVKNGNVSGEAIIEAAAIREQGQAQLDDIAKAEQQ